VKGSKYLAQLLKINKCLKVLKINNTNLKEEGLKIISKSLSKNYYLKELNINGFFLIFFFLKFIFLRLFIKKWI
jgi:Ran GTPase-activating protein (RanGAP) involved in mRNA processing and transport